MGGSKILSLWSSCFLKMLRCIPTPLPLDHYTLRPYSLPNDYPLDSSSLSSHPTRISHALNIPRASIHHRPRRQSQRRDKHRQRDSTRVEGGRHTEWRGGKGKEGGIDRFDGCVRVASPSCTTRRLSLTEREAFTLRRMVPKQAVWMVYHSPRCIRRLNTASWATGWGYVRS
jgi:hypothetical protein